MGKMIRAIIQKYWKLLISVILVASFGFALISGLSCSYLSLQVSLEDYLVSYAYPDCYLSTEIIYKEDAKKLLDIEGINGCDVRLYGDTLMQSADGKFFSTRIFSYTEAERQKFHIWSSVDNDDEKGIFLEYSFAKKNQIFPGNKVYIRIRGKYRAYTVKGLVTRPETMSASVSDQSWGLNYDFGYAYASSEFLKEEYQRDYNEEKQELDRMRQELTAEKEIAQKKLDAAKSELDAASVELKKQREKLADGKKEAETAKAELKQKKEEGERSIKELEENQQKLEQTIRELEQGARTLTEQKEKLTSARDALKKIDEGQNLLEQKEEGLKREEVRMLIHLLTLSDGNVSTARIKESMELMAALVTQAKEYGFSYEETDHVPDFLASLKKYTRRAETDYSLLMSLRVQQLLQGDSAFQNVTNQATVLSLLKRYTGKSYDTEKAINEDLTKVYTMLSTLEYTLKDPKYLLALSLLEKLDSSYTVRDVMLSMAGYSILDEYFSEEIPVSSDTAAGVVSKYGNSLSETRKMLDSAGKEREKLAQELKKYDIEITEVETALEKIEEQEKNGTSAMEECRSSLSKINDGIAQLKDGINQAEKAEKEIEKKLSDGSEAFAAAEEKFNSGKRDYEGALKKMQEKVTEAEKKLDDAYALLEQNKSYDEQCNQIMLYFDEDADAQALMEQAINVLGREKVTGSYTRETSLVQRNINSALEPMHTLLILVPGVFFVVLLVVISLFMSMMIRQSRRDIGILRALGFSRRYIRTVFCVISLGVSVFAMLVGSGLGYALLRYTGGYFEPYYSLPGFIYCYDMPGILVAATATTAVCLVSTLLSTGYISRIVPREAMSRATQPSTRVPRVLQVMMSGASPMAKFSILSILRNKGRAVFSVICISASVMMIFGGVSFIASKDYIIWQTFDQRISYDCQIYVDVEKRETLAEKLSGISFVGKMEKAVCYETNISFGGKSEKTVVNAIRPGMDMVGIYDTDNRQLEVHDGEIIMEQHLAETLGVVPGNQVYIGTAGFTVSALSNQCVNRIQYISLSDAEKIDEKGVGCLFCNLKENSKQQMLSVLNHTDGYLYALFTQSLYENNDELFANFNLAAWLLIIFAMVVGFVIVMNTMLTNIQDVKKELCILRTLGFQVGEISRSRLSRLILQLFFSVLLGLASGKVVVQYALTLLSNETTEYVFASSFTQIFFTVLLVLAYLLFSHFAAMHSMQKWDIMEAVKDKE